MDEEYGAEQEQLQAEMKLLNWHKLANDAALKAALLKTKQMKERDARPRGAETIRAQAAWMQRVIEEEQSKPLQVSKDFVLSYQERERKEEERLDSEVNRHIECLKRLREQIEKREAMKSKKEAYRRAKAATQQPSVPSSRVGGRKSVPGNDESGAVTMTDQAAGTLTTVISSLDRLVDLERRIASLEKDSIFDRVEMAAGGASAGASVQSGGTRRGGNLSFTKQRIPPSTVRPSRDVYAVRLAAKGGGGRGGRGGGGGLRRPAGYREAPEPAGATRQDAAINSWLNRKKQREQQRAQKAFSRANGDAGQPPRRGAASGRRGKNPSQQKFLDMKRQVEKRKDNMRRGGAAAASRRPLGAAGVYKASTKRRIKTNAPARGGTRLPKVGGQRAGYATTNAAYGAGRGTNRAKNGARTLPHIAGGGVKGVRGVKQAW